MDFVIENNILKGAANPIPADLKLGQKIFNALNEFPNHVAQIDTGTDEKTTCGQMKDRSVRCAIWMKKVPIQPGDLVVVVTHNHLDTNVPVFATFFVDAVFSAWSQNITLRTARRFMQQFTPKLIFACEKAVDVLMEAATLENLEIPFVVFGKHPRAQSLNDILNSQSAEEVDEFNVVDERSAEDVAAIMLSSGSTGFPKGVEWSAKSLGATRQSGNSDQTLKLMWYSTLDWISCIIFTLETILKRNTQIIPHDTGVDSYFKIVQKYKVYLTFVSPILATEISKNESVGEYDLTSLKVVIVGGCKQGKQVLESIQQRIPTTWICNGYGCTEILGTVFKTPACKFIESVGFVAPNAQIKFVDSTSGRALGPNQNGEMYAKSPVVMIGYYDNPEATKQAIDQDGWYRSGDIGYYNEDGEIFIVDRIKEIMKYRNNQIAPAEIEELLLSHPEVKEAAVIAIPHELDGDWPAAFVVRARGSQVTADELMEITSVLEDYKKLRGGIHFVDSLPRTGSGKIAKNELKQLAATLKIDKKKV